MYMYICNYINTYVYIYNYTHMYLYIYIYICKYVCIYIYTNWDKVGKWPILLVYLMNPK